MCASVRVHVRSPRTHRRSCASCSGAACSAADYNPCPGSCSTRRRRRCTERCTLRRAGYPGGTCPVAHLPVASRGARPSWAWRPHRAATPVAAAWRRRSWQLRARRPLGNPVVLTRLPLLNPALNPWVVLGGRRRGGGDGGAGLGRGVYRLALHPGWSRRPTHRHPAPWSPATDEEACGSAACIPGRCRRSAFDLHIKSTMRTIWPTLETKRKIFKARFLVKLTEF